MFEKPADQSLQGAGPELWVQVLSSEVLDLPRIREAFTADQAETFAGYAQRPTDYYPHWVTAEEREEHGFKFEDWMIFPKVGTR